MYAITVMFQVKPEFIQDFRKAVLQQAKNSLTKEEGCKRFDVCFAEDKPDRVFLYELYDDEAAFDRHVETEYFENFREISGPMLVNRALDGWELQKA